MSPPERYRRNFVRLLLPNRLLLLFVIKYAGFQEKSFHIKGVIEKHMKDQRRKRRNEQHVEEEANFIGDILKLLFALSLAIVAIVVCFLFFKNIAGFSLPNLKATEAASESSKEPVLITEAGKETKKKEMAF